MAKHQRPLPTLWEIPDDLWERIEPMLRRLEPPAVTGRPRVDRRRVLDAIIFRLRTGCQWNHIPRVYGDDSTIYRCFQDWCAAGFFKKLWARLVNECDELKGVQWRWQAADCMLGKARFGGRSRSQPHGSGEKWLQKEPRDGRRRRTLRSHRGRRECE